MGGGLAGIGVSCGGGLILGEVWYWGRGRSGIGVSCGGGPVLG